MVNSENYSINTRQSTNFHLLHANLAIYLKGVYYLSIKIFSNLPSDIKNLSDNPKKFKTVLKNLLYKNYFYTLDEYFNVKKERKK
jgi:hypothetical protein